MTRRLSECWKSAAMITNPDRFSSPKRNPNLLQRSEIVGLINTLHRISESLQSVEVFRKLYAQTQEETQAKTAAAAEEAKLEMSSRPTPKSVKGIAYHLWKALVGHYGRLRLSCQRSLRQCLKQIQGEFRLVSRLLGFVQESPTGQPSREEL
jgi:hypothetical protein